MNMEFVNHLCVLLKIKMCIIYMQCYFFGHLTEYEISKHIVVQVDEVELMALCFLINVYIFVILWQRTANVHILNKNL